MYERDLLREPDPSWPSNISEADRLKAHRAANVERASYSLGALENDQLASTARMLNHTVMSQMVITAVPRDFMADWMWQAYPDSSQETIIAESHNGCVREKMANKWHPMNTSAYVWTKTMFPTWLLRYCGDNVDLCHAVESRTPFLDHYVTEYANSLPPSLKMRYNVDGSFTEKHLLKQAVKPFVTDEVYNRKKHPFLGPTQIARDGPLHKLFERLVTRDNVAELGFVDWDKAKVLLEKTLEGDNVFAFRSLLVVAQFVVLHKRFGVKKVLTPDGQVADGHK